jgi:hypothetical protein
MAICGPPFIALSCRHPALSGYRQPSSSARNMMQRSPCSRFPPRSPRMHVGPQAIPIIRCSSTSGPIISRADCVRIQTSQNAIIQISSRRKRLSNMEYYNDARTLLSLNKDAGTAGYSGRGPPPRHQFSADRTISMSTGTRSTNSLLRRVSTLFWESRIQFSTM